MPLFDLETGVQLKVANVGKAIIGSVDNKIAVFDNIPLALDIENYCSADNKQYAARIALVAMGLDPNQKNNNYNIVFHAILNMGNIKPKLNLPPKAIHIKIYEHTDDRKSVPIKEALKLLTQYLENHLIVWKNFNCDFRALLNVGLVFTEKIENLRFIEIERFFRRTGGQSAGSAYSLDWLQKYVLSKPKIQNTKHSPVDDACHHLSLFRKIPQILHKELIIKDKEINEIIDVFSGVKPPKEKKNPFSKMLSEPEFLSDTEPSGDEIYKSDLSKDKKIKYSAF